MTVGLADIDRWDPSAVREVSKALAKRGASADEVKAGLGKLPLIASWQGSGGDAARASLDKLSAFLASHGEEMARVSSATGNAADEIERVRASWQKIQGDAQHEGFSIDRATGEVTPLDKSRIGDPIYMLQQADLETRIKQLLASANAADADLARAIATAGDDANKAGQPETRPDVLDALSKPLPDDPKQFHDLWDKLTPEEKDALYQRDHSIGNHNGMPTVDRDYYNRLALGDELNRAQAAQAQADALRNQHPDWANGQNIPPPNKPGAIFDDRLKYEAWQRQYDAATNGAKFLPDLQAVDKAVKDNPNRKLMLLDTHSGTQARAAVAIGDPDTAQHVSVTTPGLNTTVHGSIGSMTEEATNLRQESLRQLQNTPGHSLDSVSTIAWIGYDAPQVPGWDDKNASLAGLWGVSHDDLAKAGAHDLAGFYDGIGASHQGVPPELTAIGHSYGSLTTGLALQEPGNHGVTNAIFYGSPGIEASTPEQLHLQPGHVFTMETPDDPIQWVYDGPPIAHTVAAALPPPFNTLAESALAGADLSGAGQFGPNPATNPNFTHLATGAATVPDGLGGTLSLEAAHGHSDYPRFSSDGLPRTTNYNIAAVIAGLSDDAVRQK
ncbi:alpha/beta hydrolase [Mycobacterium sp.]|uniref:alpha/beta hydrolase n=1 Tax=Mycobacterium sp. TaxID=1785 RepID=UPI002C0EEE73|nr:alpha/beta hydrolase [Mycobacterium sp.]HKP42118.1 alpha/beta hydrolase [Mycobacterium sp.]